VRVQHRADLLEVSEHQTHSQAAHGGGHRRRLTHAGHEHPGQKQRAERSGNRVEGAGNGAEDPPVRRQAGERTGDPRNDSAGQHRDDHRQRHTAGAGRTGPRQLASRRGPRRPLLAGADRTQFQRDDRRHGTQTGVHGGHGGREQSGQQRASCACRQMMQRESGEDQIALRLRVQVSVDGPAG